MPPLALRTLVGAIGLALAGFTTISIPAGYLLFSYARLARDLGFEASVSASRLAALAPGQGPSWQLDRDHVAAQTVPLVAGQGTMRQSIYDGAGRLVFQTGDPLRPPIIAREARVIVGGLPVGHVDVEASLRGAIYRTGLVACLSIMLGALVYVAARVLPLNVLYRTFDKLEAAQRRVQDYFKLRFDAALDNMSQGLCMFNPDGRLTAVNRRFNEMFSIPPGTRITGMTLAEILNLAHAVTDITEDEPELIQSKLDLLVRRQERGTITFGRSNGHIISISHQPMPDGGWVETFDDVTEQRLAEARLSFMAHHDMLTGLANRLSFYEALEERLTQVARGGRLALLSLDLDDFKSVNDTLGHPLGDKLLCVVAQRLRECVRASDLVARLGGDEFALVLLDSGGPNQVTALASRLIEMVSAPYELDGHQVVIGLSVGVALAPEDGNQPDALAKNADLAMYRAKADGGNTYRFFEPQMDARMRARRETELGLRRAIVNDEFELYYQPMINLRAGQITGFEALIRWHDPEHGLIQPNEFIPIAEETGLIIAVGQWVLRRACIEAVSWPDEITVAVNVSASQFNHNNLVRDVMTALDASGLPGNRLELEITERVLLRDTEACLATLHELRRLGVKIAMDDFGTGYSSIGYLRSFPFDKIKIDQSFIRSLSNARDSLAIIRAVVGLGSSLGVATTAEGVETQEQLDCLRAEGCTEVQGFLISRPRPARELRFGLAESALVEGA